MDTPGYVAITRQSGLLREMQALAHNLANLATTGYRREGVIFAEHVHRLGRHEPSLSMAHASARVTALAQGPLAQTGGTLDFAIEGEGFFLIETPGGERLTRAGRFTPNAAGELVTPDGHRLLDAGGAPVFVPPEAREVRLGSDGTLSADGQPIAQVGLWRPAEGTALAREAGTLLVPEGGIEPAEDGRLLQGFLEEANVEPVLELARMIEVHRAYELGQSFLDREDDRIRTVIKTLGR